MKSDEIIIHLSGKCKKVFEEVKRELGLKEPEDVVALVCESFQKMREEKSQGKKGKEDCSEGGQMRSNPFDVSGIRPGQSSEIKLEASPACSRFFKGSPGAYGKK